MSQLIYAGPGMEQFVNNEIHTLADVLDLLDIPFGVEVKLSGYYLEVAQRGSHAQFWISSDLHIHPNLIEINWLRDRNFRHIKIIQ